MLDHHVLCYIQDFFARGRHNGRGLGGAAPQMLKGVYAIVQLSLPFFDTIHK